MEKREKIKVIGNEKNFYFDVETVLENGRIFTDFVSRREKIFFSFLFFIENLFFNISGRFGNKFRMTIYL
ncbi:hypothetical protein AUJ87_01715 [Candidatus Gracilibacteria bacterium CG1_02_38_174]|nr:MAG: hypothetical protein AUJ87_01715 [Candidatus Gracilibacteria bacterium CG1_02_38_174]